MIFFLKYWKNYSYKPFGFLNQLSNFHCFQYLKWFGCLNYVSSYNCIYIYFSYNVLFKCFDAYWQLMRLIWNDYFSGCDAILLGAETLRGLYPVETISTVGKICAEVSTHGCSHHKILVLLSQCVTCTCCLFSDTSNLSVFISFL